MYGLVVDSWFADVQLIFCKDTDFPQQTGTLSGFFALKNFCHHCFFALQETDF